MKINNTANYFLDNYKPVEDFLTHYHEKYDKSFREYFLYHCNNKDKKKTDAIQKYSSKMEDIKKINEKINCLIYEIKNAYEKKYEVTFTKDIHVIVGMYGSNAFAERQIIPEITFCLEKLSTNDDHLKVIIAHEFGHALHNLLTEREGIDWTKIDWFHPYITLFQEGCATYFSERIINVKKSVYFSYDDYGSDWLQFAENNQRKITQMFIDDLNQKEQPEIYKEWFSINGGKKLGYTRLGYFIGYKTVKCLLEKYDEIRAISLWKKSSFYEEVEKILLELSR